MIVWLTRPQAYEVLMGGMRQVQLWLDRPAYLHDSYAGGFDRALIDRGWASFDKSVRAKPLLTQDQDLLQKVWQEIFTSLLPKGMSFEEGTDWADLPLSKQAQAGESFGNDYEGLVNWNLLSDDKGWEGKCNTPMKRFLLKVDLRAGTVERVAPFVSLSSRTSTYVETTEITPELAVQYFHEPNGQQLPF